MRKLKEVTIDGRTYTAKELTVNQVDAVLGGEKSLSSMAEMLLDTVIPVEAVIASTGITIEEINEMTGSELETLWREVEEVNSFLARLMRKLVTVAERTEHQEPTPEPTSAPPSAS